MAVHGYSYTNRMAGYVCFLLESQKVSLNFYLISDYCQSKTLYLTFEELSNSRKPCLFEPDLQSHLVTADTFWTSFCVWNSESP